MSTLGPEILTDLDQALQREWLETDGLGGYACGTASGAHTRRYHGLLMAATQPPVGRRLLVSKLEERLQVDGTTVDLGCNLYGGTVQPEGYRDLVEFASDPWPTFTWAAGGVRLRKSVVMPHRLGVTVVKYELLEAPAAVWLSARPLVAGRDMHHLQQAHSDFRPVVELGADWLRLRPYDAPSAMALQFPGGRWQADGLWYYGFTYPVEAARGLDFTEDLYSPGEVSWLLRPGESAWLVAGRDLLRDFDGPALLAAEAERRGELCLEFEGDPVACRLARAADQFLVDREVDGQKCDSVIAGYPWFGDWGRDTMISLPGLTLATRRPDLCRTALRAYFGNMSQGLIPNHFGEGGEPSYNTVDATLWLFIALRRYCDETRDWELMNEVWPHLEVCLQAHVRGTLNHIRRDDDGLLTAGDATTQLTWMDAKVGDWVVTPRHGKAVEINALWYNALRIAEYLADRLGHEQERLSCGRLARQAKAGFAQFWNEDLGYCYDCLRPEGPDPALRPNQLLAVSLPYAPLSDAQNHRLLAAVTDQLLTPYGLRTLAPGSPGYQPRYEGDQWARDGAYHQGTVWPWLIGPYASAYLRVHGTNPETRKHVRGLLQPLVEHLDTAGVGSISEIFDAEAPQRPQGCFAQAWSVAEVLRVWTEFRLGETTA